MRIDIAKVEKLHLKHFSVPNTDKKDVINFPDFLIVGPQRTGTTWIYSNLCEHGDLRFSFPKELYFFNRVVEASQPVSLHKQVFNISHALKSPRYGLKELTKIAYFDHFRTFGLDAHDLRWYSRFFEHDRLRQTIDHVRGIDSPNSEEALIGEATASYATLPKTMIEDIISLNPDIKIVLMVRDPVQRAWSHAKKDLVRDSQNKSGVDPSIEDFQQFFSSAYQLGCGRYSEMIDNWNQCLPSGSLFVGNYRDISDRPAYLVQNILDHLGVTAPLPDYVSNRLDQPVNPTQGLAIPEELNDYLEALFADQKEWLRTYWQLKEASSPSVSAHQQAI